MSLSHCAETSQVIYIVYIKHVFIYVHALHKQECHECLHTPGACACMMRMCMCMFDLLDRLCITCGTTCVVSCTSIGLARVMLDPVLGIALWRVMSVRKR